MPLPSRFRLLIPLVLVLLATPSWVAAADPQVRKLRVEDGRSFTALVIESDPDGMLMRRVRAGEGGATGALYGNRIHREDLARLIVHCLKRDAAGQSVPPTVVGADHDQTPTHEIEDWLADQIGVMLTRPSDPSPLRANRRCRNTLLEKIGFQLSYPTWREGYEAMLGQA